MNKTAIKNFAVNARNKLIEAVKRKAFELGVREKEIKELQEVSSDGIVIDGRIFNKNIKAQRVKLVNRIKETGYEQVVEEVSYTWFNRFIALRFMEVNRYFDHDLNILSSLNPSVIASKAVNYLPLDKEKVKNLVFDSKDEELYKELIMAQCNVLHKSIPFLFEEINDYTELLFPGGLLNQDSLIREMVDMIPEEDWKEVEITGWLYQFYISEKKEQVVGLDKGIIEKNDIPCATQLFTPKWIVQYMVQNSLGKLWYDCYPESELVNEWEFFLKPEISENNSQGRLELESIKLIDPCCGSGHILVYAFELFYNMYKAQGYLQKDIPSLIAKNNLYGLEICRRAAQLAKFSLLMKLRSYSSDIKDISLNIFEIQDGRDLSDEAIELICRDDKETAEIKDVVKTFKDAKNFGSLIIPPDIDYNKYLDRIENLELEEMSLFNVELDLYLKPVLIQGQILKQKYYLVITNPPYLNKYNSEMKFFINKYYGNYKADLFSAFIYRCNEMTEAEGYCGMMTPFTWMFIKTHEKLREYILDNKIISSLVHPEYHAFFSSAYVPIATFVIENSQVNKEGIFVDLNDFYGEELQPIKLREAIINPDVFYRYKTNSKEFKSISSFPVAYSASKKVRKIFKENQYLENVAKPRQGLATADNDRFLRFWHEISIKNIGFDLTMEEAQKSGLRWFPYNKGGQFRKWYGNNEYVVNWENDGYEIRNFYNNKGKLLSRPQNTDYYFKEGITWTLLSSSKFGARYISSGNIFDVNGMTAFPIDNKYTLYFLSFLNTKLAYDFLKIINRTMAFQVGNIASLPIIFPENLGIKSFLDTLASQNISISKTDWDSFETSWDFQTHPFLNPITQNPSPNTPPTISSSFTSWQSFTESQFTQLKSNEEELNRLFIEIYDLSDELTPEVEDKDITIRKADLERDVKSFLSYAAGCMMGRYSLDLPGLAFAGGELDNSKYKIFPVDEDAIIPVLEDAWFEDDIVSKFSEFVKTVFGEKDHSENLEFIAKALGKKDNETAKERIRKYFLKDFYKDHLKIYKKRPIYWMFTSGKEQAFNALVYMHRYDKYTIARLRKDYLHELQAKIDRNIEFLEKENEKKKLSRMYKLQEELRKYEEILKHYADMQIEIDLDDGVSVNYGKFGKLLAGIG